MSDSSLKLTILGYPELEEFRPVFQFLQNHSGVGTVQTAADVSALRSLVSGENQCPDFIVVCEAWPDQFSEPEVIEILRLCPLARIVCCFGPWCDSSGRTRSIWPLAVRTPAAAAQMRLTRELAMLEDQQSTARVLPLTASRAEIFEFDYGALPVRAATIAAARVISPDRRWQEMLQAALTRQGCRVFAADASSDLDAVVYDADPWDAGREADLRSVRAAHPQARLVACIGFPRCDLDAGLRQAGADEVYFKLAPLQRLVDELCKKAENIAASAPIN